MKSLCKILIVDDESILRYGLKCICNWEEEGFVIVGEASNGEEALEKIEKLQPNIVITDVVMPILDGVDLSKIIEKKYPNIKVLILSSFGEFDYIKETFKHGVYDYLLKPKVSAESILPIIKKMSEEIDKDYYSKNNDLNIQLENELVKLFLDEEDNINVINSLSKHFYKKYFYIMKVSLNLLVGNNSNKDMDIKEKLDSIAREKLKNNIYITIIENNQYTVIINLDEMNSLEVIHNLELFAKEVKINFNKSVFVISNIIKDINILKEKNLNITEFINKCFYFDKEFIVSENVFKSLTKSPRFNYELYNTKVIGLDFNGCTNILIDYFNNVKTLLALDEYSFKKFCQNIIYNTLNTVDELEFDIGIINKSRMKIFKKIDLSFKFNELIEVVLGFIEELSNTIINQINNKNVIINKVKQYVEENYKEDMSLSDIAKELHIDYYYLSHYFKSQTNENLSIYINKVRVEKAKIYLADNKNPISKISEMVGFSEHNYFSKIFKKYTNLTPSEYRKKLLR
ncbi:response regulator transcription factor [Clostridium carnis]